MPLRIRVAAPAAPARQIVRQRKPCRRCSKSRKLASDMERKPFCHSGDRSACARTDLIASLNTLVSRGLCPQPIVSVRSRSRFFMIEVFSWDGIITQQKVSSDDAVPNVHDGNVAWIEDFGASDSGQPMDSCVPCNCENRQQNKEHTKLHSSSLHKQKAWFPRCRRFPLVACLAVASKQSDDATGHES